MKKKFNRFLTIILVLVVIGLLTLAGFWIYDKFQETTVTSDTEEAVDDFLDLVGAAESDMIADEVQTDEPTTSDDSGTTNGNTKQNKKSTSKGKSRYSKKNYSSTPMYKGFPMVGTIYIPRTKIKYPILAEVTKKSIEKSVAIFYSAGLNEPGNTIIMGHNYRNRLFFSKNKNIQLGDKIYITDLDGVTLEYTVYDKYETGEEDSSYLTLDTGGNIEVTLATCTDYDTSRRLIIQARVE